MKCRKCGATEGLHIETRINGYEYYLCRPCKTEKSRLHRQTPKGRASQNRANLKYRTRNKVRASAWDKAKSIPVTSGCVVCGHVNVHRHHPNVDEPLVVTLLCPLHHKQVVG